MVHFTVHSVVLKTLKHAKTNKTKKKVDLLQNSIQRYFEGKTFEQLWTVIKVQYSLEEIKKILKNISQKW